MRVPAQHPLRSIKAKADVMLGSMSEEFDRLYAESGRPSIPPERLLKASLLIALYSVRSDRVFCEMLDYNILFRWFLDMNLEQPGLDQSNFSLLRERLVEQDTARCFFDAVVRAAREANLLSDEHFTVDGTLIEGWASIKSFKSKDGPPPSAADGSGGMVDFRGERHTNHTHESTTDDEAKLMRKAKGKEAKLSYGAHALMENRNALVRGPAGVLGNQNRDRGSQRDALSPSAKARSSHHARWRQGLSQQRLRGASEKEEHRSPHRPDRRPQNAGARCAHDTSCRIRGQSDNEKARRGNLRLDEGLWRLAPHVRSRSCTGANARLHCGRSLQPAQDESVAARHGIGASADRGNGCSVSRTSAKGIKYTSPKRLQPGLSQLYEKHKDHFNAFCIRLLGHVER
jgi:transposase